MRASLVAIAFLSAAFAGCVETPGIDLKKPTEGFELLPATEPLWHNPQTEPHPKYNFPTLSHPAVGVNGSAVPYYMVPIKSLPLPNPVKGMTHVTATQGLTRSSGMSVFGSLAVVPSYSTAVNSVVINISDPENPKIIGKFDKGLQHRNVDFIAYPDGRLVVVFAAPAASDGKGRLQVFDITDPTQPSELQVLTPAGGSHKVNVVPGTPIVYNAPSGGGSVVRSMARGITEIYDLSDPKAEVEPIQFQNGFECHHIYFWNSQAAGKYRAICAGLQMTQIWDIADPLAPKIIAEIPHPHGNPNAPPTSVPPLTFSHFSILNYKGDVLIVGDETGGGATPACDVHVQVGGVSISGPLGNLWFYDVKDEANPKLMGWFNPGASLVSNPPAPGTSLPAGCTAHHGRLVPDPSGRDLLAMAFYGAGTVLVDFTDPKNPFLVDQWNQGTNTWEVQYYNGWLFTGDLARGMDVLKFR